MGRLVLQVATDRLTATWQLSCLPNCPQYWCATPTECLPFLGKPVSSTIQATTGPCFCIAGRSHLPLADTQAFPLERTRKCGDDVRRTNAPQIVGRTVKIGATRS